MHGRHRRSRISEKHQLTTAVPSNATLYMTPPPVLATSDPQLTSLPATVGRIASVQRALIDTDELAQFPLTAAPQALWLMAKSQGRCRCKFLMSDSSISSPLPNRFSASSLVAWCMFPSVQKTNRSIFKEAGEESIGHTHSLLDIWSLTSDLTSI